MVYTDIPIIEKRNIITDLKYKNFLLVNLCKNFSEKDCLRNLKQWYENFLHLATAAKLLQIQIRFPFGWENLSSKLKQFGYQAGLFVVEKSIDAPYALPKNIRELHDIKSIKKQFVEQQRIHHKFNPIFFDDPKKFNYDGYLNDLWEKTSIGEGKFFGLYMKGILVGFIGLEVDNFSVYICELFVEKKYRGKGFGKMLMQAGFHYVAEKPCKKIWTTLAAQNNRGLYFYKSCGFQEVAQIFFMNC